MNDALIKKEALLDHWFEQHPKVLIALSGGVDSCLVAFMARKKLGHNHAVALVGVSPSLKQNDLQLAKDFCKQYDIKLVEIYPDEISDTQYNSNPANRCFFCKSALYTTMMAERDAHFKDFCIVNGNNVSDLSDYRPGLKAAKKFNALSPLADCQILKEDVRALAHKYFLSVWDKPASPCLSSRIPYGTAITTEKLKRIEKAENLLTSRGFHNVRVRLINETARIEVGKNKIPELEDIFQSLAPAIKEFGFKSCEIDPEGLVSGKLNRDILK